jgi:hypothetical protein
MRSERVLPHYERNIQIIECILYEFGYWRLVAPRLLPGSKSVLQALVGLPQIAFIVEFATNLPVC